MKHVVAVGLLFILASSQAAGAQGRAYQLGIDDPDCYRSWRRPVIVQVVAVRIGGSDAAPVALAVTGSTGIDVAWSDDALEYYPASWRGHLRHGVQRQPGPRIITGWE